MGLDMYLEARKFVSGYDFRSLDEQNEYEEVISSIGISRKDIPAGASPIATVSVGVGYWRKANQIHDWFVQNVQGGEDDCKSYFVSREQLAELKELCKEVLADHSKAEKLLPPSSGFFFGSTDYDEWYYKDLENTVEMLEKIFGNSAYEGFDFQYQSSW